MLRRHLAFGAVCLVIVLVHVAVGRVGEPFFNNDETRHVMTGVFFRDLLRDLPLDRLVPYTTQYYLQSPALGLLVWPPLFYGVEGLVMRIFGTSMLVAKGLVGVFGIVALYYVWKMTERTHGTRIALAATLLFGFAPLVFEFSRQVMLEIPCLAFALAAIDHVLTYLDNGRRRDLWLASFAAAAAALTRFDAVYLLPTFAILLIARRRFDVLKRKEVWIAAGIAVLLVLPAYAISAREFGATIRHSASVGTTSGDPGLLAAGNLLIYPMRLPYQLGFIATALALLGFVVGLTPEYRKAASPYFAMIAATYLTFTPLAEIESRHVIYWIPAFALFAAEGARWVSLRLGRSWLFAPIVGFTAFGSVWTDVRKPAPFLVGYEPAARYVLAHTGETSVCLFDGALNGNFIYQLRRNDLERRIWVLRGDKMLYTTLINPEVAYVEYAKSEQEILSTLHRFDPELIVTEEPVLPRLPLAKLLRETLRNHPERYELLATFPVEQNLGASWPSALLVYRSRVRNDKPERLLDVPMLGLGRSLRATIPDSTPSETRPNP